MTAKTSPSRPTQIERKKAFGVSNAQTTSEGKKRSDRKILTSMLGLKNRLVSAKFFGCRNRLIGTFLICNGVCAWSCRNKCFKYYGCCILQQIILILKFL